MIKDVKDLIFQFVGPLPDPDQSWTPVYSFERGFLYIDDWVRPDDRSLRLCRCVFLSDSEIGMCWFRQ